eukprot:gene6841-7609_t
MIEKSFVWKKIDNFSNVPVRATIVATSSTLPRPVLVSSVVTKAKAKTSQYERILHEYYRNLNATTQKNGSIHQNNETSNGNTTWSKTDRNLALILPLVLLAAFLALVASCHRYDTARRTRKTMGKHTRRNSTNCWQRQQNKTTPAAEQGVEEIISKESDSIPAQLRYMNRLVNQKRHAMMFGGKPSEQVCKTRCVCKLVCCPHCTGYEVKRLQWKDLVQSVEPRRPPPENQFGCKNASTQTWMPMPIVYSMKKLPQSSQRERLWYDATAVRRRMPLPSSITTISRPQQPRFLVEAESVLDSEVSSKPHFPSSASYHAESTKEVSESFYYSAPSEYSTSVFHYDTYCTHQNEARAPTEIPADDRSKCKQLNQKIKTKKRSSRSDAKLLVQQEEHYLREECF